MGRCVSVPGPPQQISIQIPGGAKLASMPNATQQIPNLLDPFQTLMQAASPALGNLKTVGDIVSFIMAIVDFAVANMELFGFLMAAVGNPAIAELFPLKTIINTEDDVPILGTLAGEDTGVPDLLRVIVSLIKVIVAALKLVGLVPQLGAAAMIKDIVLTVIGFMEAIQAAVNGITDKLSLIAPATTGDPVLDFELECAADAVLQEIEHQLGPLSSLVPLMSLVDVLAKPLKQGLPAPVATLANVAVNLGLIPFPNDDAKDGFLDLVETMKTEGLPIELPDFSNLADIPALIDQLKEVLQPPGGPDIIGLIEQVQDLIEKVMEIE
jgi:hypothetical protein